MTTSHELFHEVASLRRGAAHSGCRSQQPNRSWLASKTAAACALRHTRADYAAWRGASHLGDPCRIGVPLSG